MADILCTNDDGYLSAGFFPLVRLLAERHTVTVVAPDGPRSWVGKSITAHTPLHLRKTWLNGVPVHILDGTPADCVQVALYELLPFRPRLVVSGVNIGANAGRARILSSGTVGAAIEAALDGVPAVASSLDRDPDDDVDYFDPGSYPMFEPAAAITARVVDRLLGSEEPLRAQVVNVNVPLSAAADAELAVTMPFEERYGRLFVRDGDTLRHMHTPLPESTAEQGTDLEALHAGKVSVTPLDLATARPEEMDRLRSVLG